VDDPTLATEAILAEVPLTQDSDWMAKTAVERLAQMTGKSVDEVRADLQKRETATSFVEKAKRLVGV